MWSISRSDSWPSSTAGQLVGGTWDPTQVLVEGGAAIEATVRDLPGVAGYGGARRARAAASFEARS